MDDERDIAEQEFESAEIPLSGGLNLLGAAPGAALPFPARALRLEANVALHDDTQIESYFLKVITDTDRVNNAHYFAVFDNVVALRRFTECLQYALVTGERADLRCDGYEFIGAVEASHGTGSLLSEEHIEGMRMLIGPEGKVPGRVSVSTVDEDRRVTGRLDAAMDGNGLVALVNAYHSVAAFSERALKRIEEHFASRPSGPGM